MGNDGGSIPTRRELVKEAARNPTTQQLRDSRNEQQDHLWNHDPLSQKPLSQPVVSDYLGRLFNKDSVIEFLLPSEDADAEVDRKKAEQEDLLRGSIKSLKDCVEVKFEIDAGNPIRERSATGRMERWICPVTRQEMCSGAKAVYLVPCGHAFSGTAVKEIAGEQCPQCNESYAENDVIPIFTTSETEIARLDLRIQSLKERGLSHSLKKLSGSGKKRKKHAINLVDTDRIPDRVEKAETNGKSKESTPQPKPAIGIRNASTASLTAKVLVEQEEHNKRRKMERNDNLQSLFTKSRDPTSSKPSDISFMNRGYAIPGRK